MSLTITIKDYNDEYDPTYVVDREYTFTSGTKIVGKLSISYGDENSANTTRGTIESAYLNGNFFTRQTWMKTGYTWRGDYVAVQYSEQDLIDIAQAQWVKLLDDLGLIPIDQVQIS